MSRPTVVVLVLTGEEIVAAALLDPIGFVEERVKGFDALAQKRVYEGGRFAVAGGSSWRLFLPGDRDVSTVREKYGDELAAELAQGLQHAPEQSVVAWKVLESIPRGQG